VRRLKNGQIEEVEFSRVDRPSQKLSIPKKQKTLVEYIAVMKLCPEA